MKKKRLSFIRAFFAILFGIPLLACVIVLIVTMRLDSLFQPKELAAAVMENLDASTLKALSEHALNTLPMTDAMKESLSKWHFVKSFARRSVKAMSFLIQRSNNISKAAGRLSYHNIEKCRILMHRRQRRYIPTFVRDSMLFVNGWI